MKDHTICTCSGFTATLRIGDRADENLFDSHCHVTYEILYILSGSVRYGSEDLNQILKAGDLVYIPPMIYHSIVPADQTVQSDYHRLTIQFESSAVPAELRELIKESNDQIFTDPSFLPIMNNLQQTLRTDNTFYAPLVESLLIQLLYAIPWHDASERATIAMDPTIVHITQYINDHMDVRCSLSDLAEQVFLSPSTISHLFREKMNIGIKQYILQKKFTYAKSLILNGQTATEAAKAIGYTNYANFYTLYKRILGETPSNSKHKDEHHAL